VNSITLDDLRSAELARIPELRKQFANLFSTYGDLTSIEEYDYFKGTVSLQVFHQRMQFFFVNQTALLKRQGINHTTFGDFINSAQNNAFCTTIDTTSYIGLHIGSWVKLNFLFSILGLGLELNLSEESRKEEITKIEEYHRLALCILNVDDLQELKKLKDIYSKLNPSSFSCNATLCCMEFILAHEYYHILLGHTRHLNDYKNGYTLNEIENNSDKTNEVVIPNVDFHTLELEADCYAGIQAGRDFDKGRTMFGNLLVDDESYILLLSYSITVLFSIFDIYGSKISDYYSMKHPHPELRYTFFFKGFEEDCKKIREDKLNSLWHKGREMALDYLMLFGIFQSNEEMGKNLDRKYMDKVFEIYQNSNTGMYEETKKHRFPGV
jgi:hypothetical protein